MYKSILFLTLLKVIGILILFSFWQSGKYEVISQCNFGFPIKKFEHHFKCLSFEFIFVWVVYSAYFYEVFVLSFKFAIGFFKAGMRNLFLEKRHPENATGSPQMSEVLYIKIVIAPNDIEALNDTKLHSESKKSYYAQYNFNILIYQSSNMLIFTKPDIHIFNHVTYGDNMTWQYRSLGATHKLTQTHLVELHTDILKFQFLGQVVYYLNLLNIFRLLYYTI